MFWRQRTSRQSSSPSVTPNELLEILLAHTYGYYVLPSEPYDEVFTNIYLGDSTTALCIHLLKRLGITHVLNAAWGRQRHLGLVNTSAAFYRNAQIEFMGIEALDMSVYPLYQHFQAAAQFIERALQQPNGKVLVHCGEGISRSSTLVIAYLMIKRGFSVTEAVRTVVKHRNILPNQGFLMQLCHLNDELSQDSGHQRYNPQPEPMENKTPQSPSVYDDDYKMSGSSRSPTPSSGLTSPNFGLPPPSRSYTPSPSFGSYSSTMDSSYNRHYISNNKSSSNNNYNSTRPIESKIQQIQRRQDFRRAQSCERPSYITRGSSYLNKSPTTKTSLYRSQHNLNNNNNHHGYNHSLMTTYLVNRPLPCMSR